MQSAIQGEREELLQASARQAAGSEGCELIDLTVKRNGPRWMLLATVDRAGGVTVEDCARVSRRLGLVLEGSDAFAGAYTLEVSSPGLTRELVGPADYRRFQGRLALVQMRGRGGVAQRRGILAGLDETGGAVRLREPDSEVESTIPIAEIAWARLDFDLPAGAAARRGKSGRHRQ